MTHLNLAVVDYRLETCTYYYWCLAGITYNVASSISFTILIPLLITRLVSLISHIDPALGEIQELVGISWSSKPYGRRLQLATHRRLGIPSSSSSHRSFHSISYFTFHSNLTPAWFSQTSARACTARSTSSRAARPSTKPCVVTELALASYPA